MDTKIFLICVALCFPIPFYGQKWTMLKKVNLIETLANGSIINAGIYKPSPSNDPDSYGKVQMTYRYYIQSYPEQLKQIRALTNTAKLSICLIATPQKKEFELSFITSQMDTSGNQLIHSDTTSGLIGEISCYGNDQIREGILDILPFYHYIFSEAHFDCLELRNVTGLTPEKLDPSYFVIVGAALHYFYPTDDPLRVGEKIIYFNNNKETQYTFPKGFDFSPYLKLIKE